MPRVTARSTACPRITCFPNEGVEGDCNQAEGAAPQDTLLSSNSMTGSPACFSNTGLDRQRSIVPESFLVPKGNVFPVICRETGQFKFYCQANASLLP